MALNPKPYTLQLNPKPYTLQAPHPTLYRGTSLIRKPLNPKPCTLQALGSLGQLALMDGAAKLVMFDDIKSGEVRNVNRFRGGLVLKAHRLVYHSTLGLRVRRVIKKRRRHMAGLHTRRSWQSLKWRVRVAHLGRSTCHAISYRGD